MAKIEYITLIRLPTLTEIALLLEMIVITSSYQYDFACENLTS